MNNQQVLKNDLSFDLEQKQREIEKMKFCIVSCYKSQMSRSRLLMFTLDTNF